MSWVRAPRWEVFFTFSLKLHFSYTIFEDGGAQQIPASSVGRASDSYLSLLEFEGYLNVVGSSPTLGDFL